MANPQFNCRLTAEVLALINAEVERLTAETGKKVSQADIVSMAIVRWCSEPVAFGSGDGSAPELESMGVEDRVRAVNHDPVAHPSELTTNGGLAAALAAVQAAREAKAKAMVMVSPRAESAAQRKARETKEHAEALAQSDEVARLMGREDIEYDLDNVRHRATGVQPRVKTTVEHHYEVEERKVKPLTRPYGHTDGKKRHAEG
jgi:hypothetical protein